MVTWKFDGHFWCFPSQERRYADAVDKVAFDLVDRRLSCLIK